MEISGLKLIRHTGETNLPDDPTFPYRLEVVLAAPSFMGVTFRALHGGCEEIIVRGMSKEALDRFIDMNGLRSHSRLQRLVVTGPDGILEDLRK